MGAAWLRQKIIQTSAIQQQRMESASGIKQKLQKSRATHMQQRNAPAGLAKTRTRMLSQWRWHRRGQSLFVLTQVAMDGKSTRRESSRRSAVAPPPIWTIACSLSAMTSRQQLHIGSSATVGTLIGESMATCT